MREETETSTSIAGVYMMTTSLITVFITASGIFIVAAFVSLNLSIKERLNADVLNKMESL
jgi:hypothetical protein